MGADDEKRDALRLLDALENGGMPTAAAVILAEDLDPVYVYVIVTFLREVYPASDPAATAVLERVVELTSSSRVLVRKHREGARDSVSHWFEAEHAYHDFRNRGPELIDRIADKLDS